MIAQFKHRAYKRAVGDRLAGSSPEARIPDGGRTQRIFNRTMFVLMGKLAKLDGRVVDGDLARDKPTNVRARVKRLVFRDTPFDRCFTSVLVVATSSPVPNSFGLPWQALGAECHA